MSWSVKICLSAALLLLAASALAYKKPRAQPVAAVNGQQVWMALGWLKKPLLMRTRTLPKGTRLYLDVVDKQGRSLAHQAPFAESDAAFLGQGKLIVRFATGPILDPTAATYPRERYGQITARSFAQMLRRAAKRPTEKAARKRVKISADAAKLFWSSLFVVPQP